MSEENAQLEADREAILEAKEQGKGSTVATYVRLSGPGWLQSALTLGGGSLASSLFLGVLAGFSLLWLQPLAMILGIIMLSAIGYVAMSTPERPFQAVNRHINPVLGWGWALATLLANMVWALPQYSLASGVLQQNLMPGVLGPESALGDTGGKMLISLGILVITLAITFTYDSGGWGIKLYELMLKLVVAGIVLCFIGVVGVLTFQGQLDWFQIFKGFIPDVSKLWSPAESFDWILECVPSETVGFWTNYIVSQQRDVIISAAATAVGINMTFLLPYSMLRRGWDKDFRGLATFDLSTGMFIPFVLATSCVVIAAATQFHPLNPTMKDKAMLRGGGALSFPEMNVGQAKGMAEKWLPVRLAEEIKRTEDQEPPADLSEEDKEKWLSAKENRPVALEKLLEKEATVAPLINTWLTYDSGKLSESSLGETHVALKEASVEEAKAVMAMRRDEDGKQTLDLAAMGAWLSPKLQAAVNRNRTENPVAMDDSTPDPIDNLDAYLRAEYGSKRISVVSGRLTEEEFTALITEKRNALLRDVVANWAIVTAAAAETPWKAELVAALEKLTSAEKLLLIHLQQKNSFDLAKALKPLTGDVVANVVFGIGVVGMTLSSITLLMLISGFVICEMLGLPPTGWPNRLGTLAATTGVLGPFLWTGSTRFWLAVPTSVFCFTLLPVAYISFFLMMNSKSLLGDEMPTGKRRIIWNTAMGCAVLVATPASVYMAYQKAGIYGLAAIAAFVTLVVVVHFAFPRNPGAIETDEE